MKRKDSDSHIPTAKEIFVDMHWDDVLKIADEAEAETVPVDCDNEGEDWWKFRTDYYWGNKKIFEEFWHIRPDSTMEYNALHSALHDGQLGVDMMEKLWEKEKEMATKYKVKANAGAPKRED